MVFKLPPSQSNGPDRFRLHPNCSEHQAGKRTGLKDSCCCCNPCLYRRFQDISLPIESQHCCRCSPRFITAKYTPTGGTGDCCRTAVSPLEGVPLANAQDNAIKYNGHIAGYGIEVYLSRDRVSGSAIDGYDEMDCRWTIRIPDLNIDQEIEVDHTNVTCLGVPSLEVTNVSAFSGCVGTISLGNVDTAKVPFRRRTFPDEFYDGEDTLVTLPTGCGDCTKVSRFLCVTGKRTQGTHSGFDARSERLAEFEWEQDYGGFQCGDHLVVGRWVFEYPTSPTTVYTEYIYLLQDYYGECFLWTAFYDTTTCENRDDEVYRVIPLSECGCDIKELSIPSIPLDPLLGIDIRSGACTCWGWHCEQCRCVPRYLCGIAYINQTMVKDIRLRWDVTSKSWVEITNAGAVVTGGITVSLTRNQIPSIDDHGFLSWCTLTTTINGYPASVVPDGGDEHFWDSCGPIMAFEFDNSAAAPDEDYGWMLFRTSFDSEDCKFDLTCTDATPCADDCGSHPEEVFLTIRGWNHPDDEPGFEYEECGLDNLPLLYWEKISLTGGASGFEIECGYIGYHIYPFVDVFGTTHYELLTFRLSAGILSVDTTGGFHEEWILNSESCDPYIGHYHEEQGLGACFFDQNVTVQRYTVDILE